MPLFDFVCTQCGANFEQLVRTPQQATLSIVCPVCKGTETQKKLSAFAVAGNHASSNSSSGANCAPGGT
jgi:putative FmdB family regulatory protein